MISSSNPVHDPNPYAQQSRDAARAEFASANRRYTEAKQLYHRIR